MSAPSGLAVASLGQIVQGYTVVFGKEDAISLRALDATTRCDYLDFVGTARKRVEQRFGPTVLFEHGAAMRGTDVSCGVNRLHLHIVPYKSRLLSPKIREKFECKAIVPTVENMLEVVITWDPETPYFWIEERGQVSLFSYGEKRESQVIRRVIAQQVGASEQWNWREYPTQELAERIALGLQQNISPRQDLQLAEAL